MKQALSAKRESRGRKREGACRNGYFLLPGGLPLAGGVVPRHILRRRVIGIDGTVEQAEILDRLPYYHFCVTLHGTAVVTCRTIRLRQMVPIVFIVPPPI